MMTDLILGSTAILTGLGGLIAIGIVNRRLPEWNRRRARLERMDKTQLHAELTRCTGAIMACARKGNVRGMRHAHRAMRPVMRALNKKADRSSGT